MDFGRLLASFFELYIGSVSKRYPRAIFGGFGPPTWRPRGGREVDFCSCLGNLFSSWGCLRAKLAPRGLQDPSKRPLGTDFKGFWAQLGGFWLPFWWILDGFCTRSSFIFASWPTNQPNHPINFYYASPWVATMRAAISHPSHTPTWPHWSGSRLASHQPYIYKCYMHICMYVYTDRQAGRQIDRQTDWQTDRQRTPINQSAHCPRHGGGGARRAIGYYIILYLILYK